MVPRGVGLLSIVFGLCISMSAGTIELHAVQFAGVEESQPAPNIYPLSGVIDVQTATPNMFISPVVHNDVLVKTTDGLEVFSDAVHNDVLSQSTGPGTDFELVRPERTSMIVDDEAPAAPAPVPEPSSIALMATGLAGFYLVRRGS